MVLSIAFKENKIRIHILNVKCHHNDIVNYIQTNLLENENKQDTFIQCLKHYNFSFIQPNLINELAIYEICHYGYYLIADFLLKNNDIDINQIIVQSFNTI